MIANARMPLFYRYASDNPSHARNAVRHIISVIRPHTCRTFDHISAVIVTRVTGLRPKITNVSFTPAQRHLTPLPENTQTFRQTRSHQHRSSVGRIGWQRTAVSLRASECSGPETIGTNDLRTPVRVAVTCLARGRGYSVWGRPIDSGSVDVPDKGFLFFSMKAYYIILIIFACVNMKLNKCTNVNWCC